jgi:nitrogen fixation/metabolism regulation signal transduction histidine kinase
MEEQQQQGRSEDSLRKLKHDIKNQLSNIYLALEQLKYEMPEATADCLFYLDTISTSSIQINNLLNDSE